MGVASGPDAVWVATRGGHLLAFDPRTADVLLVHHKKCSLSYVLRLSDRRLLTFGEGVVGEEEGEGEGGEAEEGREIAGMFTVWEHYVQ